MQVKRTISTPKTAALKTRAVRNVLVLAVVAVVLEDLGKLSGLEKEETGERLT